MPSVREFGSRRLMANPGAADKCANATAAMRDRVRGSMALLACPANAGHAIFRGVAAQSRAGGLRITCRSRHRARQARPGDDYDAVPCSSRARLFRLVGRGLLAFGHELLSLLAVQALAIGFL